MSKKEFNPYRDMLDIPSLIDENPSDYQLLGVDDFEGDSDKIAAAHEKRMQRIAELYQIITNMSQKIDEARDRISDSQKKEEYDNYLRKTGRAGVAHLGKIGSACVLFSFVLSIFIVVVSTFYIYPMVVTIPPENIGDSIATLPNYNEIQTQKELDVLKVQQEDVSTMDVNFNLPFDVDADSSVDFVDVPASDIPGEETSLDELPDADAALTAEESTAEEPAVPDVPAVEEPTTPEEPAVPEEPEPAAPEEQELEEPAVPEVPAVPEEPATSEPAAVEEPAVTDPAVPEEPIELEAPDVDPPIVDQPAVDQPAEPEDAAIVKPSEESPDIIVDPVVPETPAVPDVPDVPADLDTPTVPKTSSLDNAGIPELPPLEEMAGSKITASNQEPTLSVADAPIAPQPPMIPELSPVPDAPVAAGAGPHGQMDEVMPPKMLGAKITASNQEPTLSGALEVPAAESNVALEDVDKLETFVQLGQKAHSDADFAQLIFSARQAEEDLMKEKMFPKAQQIADVVYVACARCADKTYRSEAYRAKELVSKRSAWWDAVQAAQAKLDSDGTLSSKDASIIAQWTIEIEDDWETGLKYLAMSDNEQVRNAARNEILANPSDVRAVLTIANSWWNLAQDPVPMQRQFRTHACSWYAKALPSIADKQIRILVEKRISMAENGYSKR